MIQFPLPLRTNPRFLALLRAAFADSALSSGQALTQEIAKNDRDVEAQFSLCGDFLPQFASVNGIGHHSDAWFATGQVIDRGRRASKPIGLPTPNSTQ